MCEEGGYEGGEERVLESALSLFRRALSRIKRRVFIDNQRLLVLISPSLFNYMPLLLISFPPQEVWTDGGREGGREREREREKFIDNQIDD